MPITDSDLDAAVAAGVISPETRLALASFAGERRGKAQLTDTPPRRFDAIHVLYYFGALVVMGAMGLFSNLAFNALGGVALTTTALLYALGFALLGWRLWRDPTTRTPGGLAVTVAVAMMPLAVYGVEDALHLWGDNAPAKYRDFFPLINANWVAMEAATVAACAVALRLCRFPFILFVASVALWFLSMDLAILLIGHRSATNWDDEWTLRRDVSMVVGSAMVLAAWALDLRWTRAGDFGFWLHLFGAAALWAGLTSGEGGEFGKLAYFVINLGFLAFGVLLNRRIYAVFGGIGIVGYIGHLAYDVFPDLIAFSFVMSAIGVAIIFLGIALERRRAAIGLWVERTMPSALLRLRPERARCA